MSTNTGLLENGPKLVYLKEPAPDRQPGLASLLAAIQTDEVSYRRFRDADELRSLVADDLEVLISERFGPRRVGPSRTRFPIPRPASSLDHSLA